MEDQSPIVEEHSSSGDSETQSTESLDSAQLPDQEEGSDAPDTSSINPLASQSTVGSPNKAESSVKSPVSRRWASPRFGYCLGGNMTVDVENQRRLLIPTQSKMPKWDQISKIIETNDVKELRLQLGNESLEMVVCPQDSQHYKTALHAAVESSAMECLKTLLEALPSQDMLDSPDSDGNAPLHAAVKSLNSEAIAALLVAGANPNLRNDQGHSPLHLLAYAAANATSSDQLSGVMKCTNALLQSPILDIEALNNSKITPLRAAAGKFPCKASSLEEFCKKLVRNGANVDNNTRTILDKHCVPKIIHDGATGSYSQTVVAKLLNVLILNQPEVIAEVLKPGQQDRETRSAANSYFGSKKILYYVVDRGNESGVKALLNAGADPWATNRNGELALHRALARGHVKVVNMLINEMKKNNRNRVVDLRHKSFTLMQKALETKTNDKIKPDIYDPNKCLQRLFENDVLLDVNQKEEGSVNQTALHLAGAMNNQEAMAILLEHGAYLGEHRVIGRQDNGTVLNVLLPKTLNKSMDNCINVRSQTNENSEDDILDPDYTLEMNYRFLLTPIPTEPNKGLSLENEVSLLFDISQSKEHRNAIKHPLIQTFLYAKWRKVFPLYILNLILYLLFVILLTAFMYGLKNLRVLENMAEAGNSTATAIVQEEIARHQAIRATTMAFVLIITVYMTVKEIFQIAFTYKSYFGCIENYLEWFLILSVLVASVIPLSVSATRHLAAWAMIAAWYQFVLVLGRAPPLAIYITMLRHVSWNFLKLIFLFGFLIIAFSISFNIILQPSDNLQSGDFADFWTTLPRAIVMSTGEFEYSNISEDLATVGAVYATSAVLIFLVFLFLIFLVLMNVMTGLAVTDAKEIVEDAVLYSLKSRLELVYLNEQLFIKMRFLQRLLPRLQLLSSRGRRLLVKINKLPKSERISFGEHDEHHCRLDNRTAEVIRTHRLNRMAALREANVQDPTEQILQLLQDVRDRLVASAP